MCRPPPRHSMRRPPHLSLKTNQIPANVKSIQTMLSRLMMERVTAHGMCLLLWRINELSKIPQIQTHSVLMNSVRGSRKSPGKFRTEQNWIGPDGCTIETAKFVPPAPNGLLGYLKDLESYMARTRNTPRQFWTPLSIAQFFKPITQRHSCPTCV